MLHIDGSHGEGGGQIIRSALSLSALTGRDMVVNHIRAGRKQPGLLRQHLTAVRAMADICSARLEGHRLHSTRLTFHPGPVRGGTYTFRTGSAGSATLVLQTVLPPLMLADRPSTVIVEGGTHNPWAPPFDFLDRAFAPLLDRMGPRVHLALERHGFYPAGGGRLRAEITPCKTLGSLHLLEAGEVTAHQVKALVSRLPEHIGWRECRTIAHQMQWDENICNVETVRTSSGPGNVVFVELHRPELTEIFTGFGQRGVPAEKVADGVVRQVRRYLAADVPVGEYLADQLLLPLAIGAHAGSGGGSFRTPALSPHASTQLDIIAKFLDVAATVEPQGDDAVVVRIRPHG